MGRSSDAKTASILKDRNFIAQIKKVVGWYKDCLSEAVLLIQRWLRHFSHVQLTLQPKIDARHGDVYTELRRGLVCSRLNRGGGAGSRLRTNGAGPRNTATAKTEKRAVAHWPKPNSFERNSMWMEESSWRQPQFRYWCANGAAGTISLVSGSAGNVRGRRAERVPDEQKRAARSLNRCKVDSILSILFWMH